MFRRPAFDDRGPPKNSYEAAERVPCKALRGYDVRPHWVKNEDRNEDHAERAGKDEEEREKERELLSALKRSDFDETMDVLLASQDLIHARALTAHGDRMRILARHLGIPVWERAAAEHAPGAQRAAQVSQRQLEQLRIEEAARSHFSSEKATAAQALAGASRSSTGSRSSSKPPAAVTATAASPVAAEEPALPPGAESLRPEIVNAPHIAILTPPFHGAAPISHRHLMHNSLSYKMDNAVARMNKAAVDFQLHQEAARRQAVQSAADFARQHDAARGKKQHALSPPPPPGKQQLHLQTAGPVAERIARERRLEDGLFTPYHQQSHVAGLRGSPFADPHASHRFSDDPTKHTNRRYPVPHAFVIH